MNWGMFVVSFLTALSAQAGLPDFHAKAPWCDLSYRADSYYAGLAAVLYTGRPVSLPYVDTMCVQLGRTEGKAIAARVSGSECATAFEAGRVNGVENAPNVVNLPSECSNAGYGYGQAQLAAGARTKNSSAVGSRCVEAYRRGKDDGCNSRISISPSENKEAYCYQMGYTDGSFFRLCD